MAHRIKYRPIFPQPHRICLSVPLYHCFGCVAGTVCGMLYGATCVMPSAGFDPDAIVRTLGSEKLVGFWFSLWCFYMFFSCKRERDR